MKVVKQILVGSSAFFSMYEDYESKDRDYVCLVDLYDFKGSSMRVAINNDDLMLYPKNVDKEYFFRESEHTELTMKAGKFLAPEFIEYFGVTIEDIRRLEPIIMNIDDRHSYQKIICQAYLANNAFKLTPFQRELAFAEYKKKKKK